MGVSVLIKLFMDTKIRISYNSHISQNILLIFFQTILKCKKTIFSSGAIVYLYKVG